MKRNKSSLSSATTYREIGEFWDEHSLADYWDQTEDADFQVDIQSEVIYYPLARGLSKEIRKEAKRQGVTPETLLNIWIQERLHQL
jgi:hypothetical protein